MFKSRRIHIIYDYLFVGAKFHILYISYYIEDIIITFQKIN